MSQCRLSVVVPCYNEECVLREAVATLTRALAEVAASYEIILVDDGSRDHTFPLMKELAAFDPHVKCIRFTRNFGKESAIHAGLEHSRGQAVVIMDADLQHPPEMLKTFYRHWEVDGYDVVEAVKEYGAAAGWFVRLRSKAFNRVMSKLTRLNMEGASDYKLLDRKVVDVLLRLPENNRLFRALTNWTGYRTKQVRYKVPERVAGETKWSIFSLVKLSTTAITAFSDAPLQIITSLGIFTMVLSVLLGIHTLYQKFYGNAVSGFTTVILLTLLLSAVIMISLGIIGVYLANVYLELKGRPSYLVSEISNLMPFHLSADPKTMASGGEGEYVRGAAALLRRQLVRRFHPLPADVDSRIDSARTEEIHLWADRILDAGVLEDVFRSGRKTNGD